MAEALDRKKITDELEQLQLEETRERVESMRLAKANRERNVKARDRDLRNERLRRIAAKEACWHKKGGKGVAMLAHGNDHNYAVVKHVLSYGPTIVICQRCLWVWEPPDPALRQGNKEQRELYKKLYDEYQWAFNLPTDNETSGTQIFVLSPAPPPEASAA